MCEGIKGLNIFSQLRLVVLIRRGVRAIERIADAHESVAQVLLDQQQREHPSSRKPKQTDIGTMDLAEIEKSWKAEREREAEDVADHV